MALKRRQSYPTDLTNEQWAYLEPLLAQPKGKPGRPRQVDTRQVVNAILYLVRTGCQWRMLPRDFPAWQTVYYYYNKWTREGTWERIMDTLRREVRQREGRAAEPTAAIIDSQTVKGTETSGERGWDGGKKDEGAQAPSGGGHVGPAPGALGVPR